jgi:hypothetical protein
MPLFNDRKLAVTSPSLRGYERAIREANLDSDPSTISLKELDQKHRQLEAIYKDSEDWGPMSGPNMSPQWDARYRAAALENVRDIVVHETRSPVVKGLGNFFHEVLVQLALKLHVYG